MIRKIIGASILVILFGGIFVMAIIVVGFFNAVIAFTCGFVLLALVWLAVSLLVGFKR